MTKNMAEDTTGDPDLLPTGAWELPEEFRMLRDTVRRFMESDVRPLEDKLEHDAEGAPPSC